MTWRAGMLAIWTTSIACSSAPRAPASAPGRPPSAVADACAMVEAAMSLDAVKTFACGTVAMHDRRVVVDVDIQPSFAAGEHCASDTFAIYQDGELTNTDAVLRLTMISRDDQTWSFTATYFDPPNSPDDHLTGSGFDDANYYCVLGGGRLARSASGWRAWHEPSMR